jgi:hypothetical protein
MYFLSHYGSQADSIGHPRSDLHKENGPSAGILGPSWGRVGIWGRDT